MKTLTTRLPEGERIVSMIEHTYRGKKYVFVATERSVYVSVPADTNATAKLVQIPFEITDD